MFVRESGKSGIEGGKGLVELRKKLFEQRKCTGVPSSLVSRPGRGLVGMVHVGGSEDWQDWAAG